MPDRYDALLAVIENAVNELREMAPRKDEAEQRLSEAIEEATKDGR